MEAPNLFRAEVLQRRSTKSFGNLFINVPCAYRVAIGGALVLLIVLVLILWKGRLTEQTQVRGYINFSQNPTRIFGPQPGIVEKIFVPLTTSIHKGEPLFLIDRAAEGYGAADNAATLKYLLERKKRLEASIAEKTFYLKSLAKLLDKKFIAFESYQNQCDVLEQLQKEKAELENSIIKLKAGLSYMLYAPFDGIISNLMVHQGQSIAPNTVLATVVAHGVPSTVELFIPLTTPLVLKMRQKFKLSIDAYPSIHHGYFAAEICQISRSVLQDGDEEKPLQIGQPYYKVIARFMQPYLLLGQMKVPFMQGMTVKASFVGHAYPLWQWILGWVQTSSL